MNISLQRLLSGVQSLTAPHNGVGDHTGSHFARSQARDLSGVYLEGDRGRARGEISMVMSKQEILLFFTREIKQNFLGKRSNEKVRSRGKAGSAQLNKAQTRYRAVPLLEGPVWVQEGTRSASGTPG